ncbi:TIGR03086 family metal-binding protein [Streptomyces griseosporeus]|uniref:TIGR03086 family metal-binding protein n=1 Tax=Streptomyces griseosporeus TaxID=1910 RepID=UPI00368F248E
MDTDDTKRDEFLRYGIGELLRRAAARAVPLVRGIPDEALTAPTPCPDYDVRALADHLFHVVVEFQKLAARQDADFSVTPRRVGAGGDWRERFADETDKLVAAWSAPGAEDGTTGAWQMPARLVGSMALLDLVVHAWDLARATGRTYPVDEELAPVVGQLRASVAELAPTGRKMGAFGEPVPAPEGATEFERLLGETGRDPRWEAPGEVPREVGSVPGE